MLRNRRERPGLANRDVRAERAQRHIARYILVTGCYLFALSSKEKALA
jgi:hypothetical protein